MLHIIIQLMVLLNVIMGAYFLIFNAHTDFETVVTSSLLVIITLLTIIKGYMESYDD